MCCLFTGGPSAPEPAIRVINSSLYILEWEEPFTWPEFPIVRYTLYASADGYAPLNTQMIPADQTSFPMPLTGLIPECQEVEFSLRANNGLAESSPGTVQGGFPIGESS